MKIEIKDLSFSYQEGVPILKNISTTLGEESVAIIGQNGAGKTTFIRHLNHIYEANSGSILIDGVDVTEKPLFEWAQVIGYVFQNPNEQLFQESIYKEIEFGLKASIKDDKKRHDKVLEIAEFVGLSEQLLDHPSEIHVIMKW